MPYVTRDDKGHINAIFSEQNALTSEQLSINDPELLTFVLQSDSKDKTTLDDDQLDDIYNLKLSDLGMIRVLEDLIELLFEKDIIAISELPKVAQERLKQRQLLRKKLAPFANAVSETNKDFNVLNPNNWLEEDTKLLDK